MTKLLAATVGIKWFFSCCGTVGPVWPRARVMGSWLPVGFRGQSELVSQDVIRYAGKEHPLHE